MGGESVGNGKFHFFSVSFVTYWPLTKGTFGGVMVSTSEFESHWVPYSFGLVPHRNKELRKLLLATHQ